MKYKVIVNCNVIGFGRAVVGQEIELNSFAENNSLILNGSLELIKENKTTKADKKATVESEKIIEASTEPEIKSKTTK